MSGHKTIRRWISPLGLRIWVIVAFPLAIFYIGLVQVDQYRTTVLNSEIDALFRQGNALAGSIAITDAADGVLERRRLADTTTVRAYQLITGIPDARIRVFQPGGILISDNVSTDDNRPVDVSLAPGTREEPGRLAAIAAGMRRFGVYCTTILTPGDHYPAVTGDIRAKDIYTPVVDSVLAEGEPKSLIMRDADGGLVLGVAVPIRHLLLVRGALLITASGAAAEEEIASVQYTFFAVFMGALGVTIILGYYLARSIIGPMTRLAHAADTIRLSRDSTSAPAWPEIIDRSDEIGDLARDIAAMTDELQQRIEATASFAADVAHELKNPLTSLRSAVETFARLKPGDGDDDKRAKLTGVILDDVGRLDRLISDISVASRLDSDIRPADFSRIDLGGFTRSFAEARDAMTAARGITLAVDVPASPVCVRAIETSLVQVLDNLLANAVSFSPEGGVIRLVLDTDPVAGFARLAMHDEGPGIPEARCESVFARFYSERPAGESFGQHSGLGLSISRKIAEIHGGSLAAGNTVKAGKTGAVLTLSLPLADGKDENKNKNKNKE